MFFNKDKEIERLKELIEKKEERHRDALTRVIEDSNLKIARLETAHKDEVDRLKTNEDVRVAKETQALTTKVSKLEADLSIAKKEVEMYEKAFENLGFDVKDMKEILNKLVDGVVAKGLKNLIAYYYNRKR